MKMNKKGQVTDFFGGIQRFFSWFLTSAPRPLQLIFFLAILLLFGVLIGWFVNLTGNFCDTQGNEYETGFTRIITNFDLLIHMPDNDDLDNPDNDPDGGQFGINTVTKCSWFIPEFEDWNYKLENGTIIPLPEGYYFHDNGRCTQCESVLEVIPPEGNFFTEKLCSDNILYPKEPEDLSLWGKFTCGKTLGACQIPLGYYYNRITDEYVCDDPLCTNDNTTTATVGSLWNLKLKESGAKIKPISPHDEKDYRNMVSLTCDTNDVQPKIKLYGLNIFDYRMWVFLFILATLVWLVFKIKKK